MEGLTEWKKESKQTSRQADRQTGRQAASRPYMRPAYGYTNILVRLSVDWGTTTVWWQGFKVQFVLLSWSTVSVSNGNLSACRQQSEPNSCYWSWARCQIFLCLEWHTNEAKESIQFRIDPLTRLHVKPLITAIRAIGVEDIKLLPLETRKVARGYTVILSPKLRNQIVVKAIIWFYQLGW